MGVWNGRWRSTSSCGDTDICAQRKDRGTLTEQGESSLDKLQHFMITTRAPSTKGGIKPIMKLDFSKSRKGKHPASLSQIQPDRAQC